MSALLACTGALFWLLVYAAAYRGRRQDVRSPEVVHVVFVGVGCVLSGIGFFLLAGGLWGAELGAVTTKEMSLAGVQIPLDPAMIPDGKQFFRMGEFAGWVIEG